MLTTRNNRLDPSLIPDDALAELAKAFAKPDHVALIDAQGNRTHLPEALFVHFARIVRLMSERKAVVLVPEDETFTTQAAANYLGVSRQHLVGLLEKQEIPHHKVGTHRRVSPHNVSAREFVRSGKLGDIGMVKCFVNYGGGPETPLPTVDVPKELDWDFWCGPAPLRQSLA